MVWDQEESKTECPICNKTFFTEYDPCEHYFGNHFNSIEFESVFSPEELEIIDKVNKLFIKNIGTLKKKINNLISDLKYKEILKVGENFDGYDIEKIFNKFGEEVIYNVEYHSDGTEDIGRPPESGYSTGELFIRDIDKINLIFDDLKVLYQRILKLEKKIENEE